MDLCTATLNEPNTMETLKALKKEDASLIMVYYPVKQKIKSKVIQYLVNQGLEPNCYDPFFTEYWEVIRTKLVLLKVKQQ